LKFFQCKTPIYKKIPALQRAPLPEHALAMEARPRAKGLGPEDH